MRPFELPPLIRAGAIRFGPLVTPSGVPWLIAKTDAGRVVISMPRHGARIQSAIHGKRGTGYGYNPTNGCLACVWDDGTPGNPRLVDVLSLDED